MRAGGLLVLSGKRKLRGPDSAGSARQLSRVAALVVAYALPAASISTFTTSPWATASTEAVFLRDIWPSAKEVSDLIERSIKSTMFRRVMPRC